MIDNLLGRPVAEEMRGQGSLADRLCQQDGPALPVGPRRRRLVPYNNPRPSARPESGRHDATLLTIKAASPTYFDSESHAKIHAFLDKHLRGKAADQDGVRNRPIDSLFRTPSWRSWVDREEVFPPSERRAF
jgi:hypothetical protein